MCATHNITTSTKKIITRELKRASVLTGQIADGKLQWKDLFQKHTFFTQDYKYYLSIVAASRTKEAQLIWSGLVESKVRRLVTGIETSQAGVELAHPFNKGFDRVHRCQNEEEIDMVLQGNLQFQAPEIKTETTDVTNDPAHAAAAAQEGGGDIEMPKPDGEVHTANGDGPVTIYTTTYYMGIELTKESKSLDISFPVQDFKRQCTDWPQYDATLNSIRIIHTRKLVEFEGIGRDQRWLI